MKDNTMTENTMRDAFEVLAMPWFNDDPNNFKWDGSIYENTETYGNRVQIAWQGYQAAIAHQNQEAVPIYEMHQEGIDNDQ